MTARVSVQMAARILNRKPADILACLHREGWATGRIATLEGQRAGVVTMEDQMMVLEGGRRKPYRAIRITGTGLDLLSRCLERHAA